MQSYTCPNCGTPVKMDDHGAFLECPYCGSQFKPDDIQPAPSEETFSAHVPDPTVPDEDDDEELRAYAEIVNCRVPEFTVNDFIDGCKHCLELTLDFLGNHGMYIQVGVVLFFVIVVIISFFL